MQKAIRDRVEKCFIEALSCVIGEEKAIYASTPITNGPLLLEKVASDRKLLQLDRKDFVAYVWRVVVPRNEDNAKLFVRRLRSMQIGVVIDPSSFFSEDLSQEDYLVLWGEVIKRFANSVWFNSGWAFSRGCVTEYCIAIENGIPTFDNMGCELLIPQAIGQISKAIEDLAVVGLDVGGLEKQIDRLRTFPGGCRV
jgi:hypothetical protein